MVGVNVATAQLVESGMAMGIYVNNSMSTTLNRLYSGHERFGQFVTPVKFLDGLIVNGR
jgi:hypothetical protein